MTTNESSAETLVHVVKGNPSDEEIAAIVAVVSAAVAPPEEGPKAPRDRWGVDTSRGVGANPNVPWAFPNVSHLRW